MAAEENKALTRRVIEEIFTEGNLDLADDLIAPDCVNHDPAMPEEVHGIEGFKELVRMYRSAFPDLHVEVEDQVAEGDKVATRWTASGTHDGELAGIPATGNWVEITGMEISRISGGKIAEVCINSDDMGMMQQLGAIPSPEEQAQA
jgi:steroid delta-isomerase-like uncharacterized protein